MLLSEAIEGLVVATIADGRSARTAADYRQRLAELVIFLGDVEVRQVTGQDLRRFIAGLRQRDSRYQVHPFRGSQAGGLSMATIAGMTRCVKRLFAFLVADGVLVDNPAKVLKVQRQPKGREPKAVSLDDLVAMLQTTAGNEPAQVRDRALLLFLADTGCRIGGLVGLRLADVDLAHQTGWVIEKGDKRRPVYFTDGTAAAMVRWLAERPAGGSDRVFVRVDWQPGQALTPLGVSEILKRIGRRAGVTGPHNPHAFRHAFAREYLHNGGDLATLSDLLGHADITVTAQSYAVFLPNELQARHDRFSPVSKLQLGLTDPDSVSLSKIGE